MALVINSNISSLNAQRNLSTTQNALNVSLQRLSSGLRINSAKDDAAGLAISDRMTSQVRGLNQAVRNANDGISLAQTAEGALQESTNILQRIRELGVQSANDTNSASDRASLQKEVSQLQQELNRIAETTSFNGRNLLDGSFSAAKFQVGANANQTISVSIGNARATHIGTNAVTGDGTLNNAVAAAADFATAANPVLAGEDLTVSGSLGTAVVDVAAGASAKDIVAGINAKTANTGVEAEAVTKAKIDNVSGVDTFTFKLYGSNTTGVDISVQVNNTADLGGVVDAINAKTSSTGITAELDSNGAVILNQSEGFDIGIEDVLGAATATFDVTGLDAAGVAAGGAQTLGAAVGTDSTRVGGSVSFNSPESFTVTSAAAGGIFAATTANGSALDAVASIDVGTQAGANAALSVADGALAVIDNIRADLGAVQNRFESTIANLQNVSENVSAARSRIQDADFAQETAALTRGQILQQAGLSILAQANQSQQSVLSLLR